MTQSVLNSGQFRGSAGVNGAAAVSLLDVPTKSAPAVDTRPYALWPIVAVTVGGVLTLVWDVFLLWLLARVVIYWLD